MEEHNIPKKEQQQPPKNTNFNKPQPSNKKSDNTINQSKPANFSIPEGLDFNEITGNLADTNKPKKEEPPKKSEVNIKQKSSKTPIPERTPQQTLNNDFAGLFSNVDFSAGTSQQPQQNKPSAKIDPSCKLLLYNIIYSRRNIF